MRRITIASRLFIYLNLPAFHFLLLFKKEEIEKNECGFEWECASAFCAKKTDHTKSLWVPPIESWGVCVESGS